MLIEATRRPEEQPGAHHGRLLGLLTAAFATSIDAAAAGLTLPLLGVALPVACLVIAGTTAALCTIGYLAAAFVTGRAGQIAELVGGFVLIGLGLRILITHLTG